MMCPRGGWQQAHATTVYGRVQGAAGVGGAERAQNGGRKTAGAVCREYQRKPDLLTRGKADFVTQAATVFAGDAAGQQAVAELGLESAASARTA